MNETINSRTCSRCHATLPSDAPEGLCPRCLMALNLAAQTEEFGPEGTKIITPKIEPLSIAEIAKLFPQFEVIEFLGRGGMGLVYKARQPRLDRFVALKILVPDPQNRGRFAERFEREARALAKLSHPNIVSIYDFGESGGFYFLVMEFVDGVNLRELIHTQKMSAEQALAIVPPICDALQFAHTQGIVHRDIKPENILLDKQGRVKIADFGIAKIIGTETKENLTGEQQTVGTPHYMAPEQIEKPTTVDHRADIYSLGVVFYEMLTGELPLGKFQPPSKKVQVDVRLDEIVLHALEKEPERRYQHASQVKTDVETVSGGASIQQLPVRSPWVRFFESVSGITFMSRGAVKSLNISALGFLGFLGSLGTIPGMRPFSALAGFFGFFGLIGIAYLIEIAERRRTVNQSLTHLKSSGQPLKESPARNPQISDWLSLFFVGRGWFFGILVGLIFVSGLIVWGVWERESSTVRTERATSSTLESQTPPVVVQTIPQSGASDVDPSLNELRVTFSEPMQDQSWSWVQLDEETFPEMTGQPRFLTDERTCLLPVKLKPGKVYAIWLNVDEFKYFQDITGQSAVPYLLIFETRK